MLIPAYSQIVTAYAKACIHNPKVTISDNMARAFEDCPQVNKYCLMHEEVINALHDYANLLCERSDKMEEEKIDGLIAKMEGK